MTERRRFPRPWTVEDGPACLTVVDANGQKLAYVYYEGEGGRRAAAKLLTYDEARRIAANIAKLPDLLQRPSVRTKYPNMRKWDEMTDRQKIVLFRDAAERLRAKPTARVGFMTAEEWADAFDDHADQIEVGDLDEESPEQAAAETEAAKQVIELLKRYDAGSLGALFKRFER